jgi:hypothetical protein
MEFQWGCLPAGTEISLDGGKSTLIENITEADMVLASSSMEPMEVRKLMRGTEVGHLVQIEDEFGHRLAMTKEHPVPLVGREPVLASELESGELVWTAQGVGRIVSVELVEYDGLVYNFEVEQQAERYTNASTMFANGILVGDGKMQKQLSQQRIEQRRSDKTIPEHLRGEYFNAVLRQTMRDLGLM